MGAPGISPSQRRDAKRLAERHATLEARTADLDLTVIPNWPRYSAGRDGSIWATDSNWRGYGLRALSTTMHAGYPSVRLVNDDRNKRRFPVHRLIALTFHGPCPDGCDQVRHLDGNPLNSSAANLAWGSAADNAADRASHGRTAFGTREWWAENKHSAHLFAASPDLYDQLAFAVKLLDAMPGFRGTAQLDRMHAALAKARGES